MFSELSEEFSDVLAGIKQLETTERVLKTTPFFRNVKEYLQA